MTTTVGAGGRNGSTLLFGMGNDDELEVAGTVGVCVDVLKGLLRGAGTGVGIGVGTVTGDGFVIAEGPPDDEANGFTNTFFVGIAGTVSGTVVESKISEPAIFRGPVADTLPPLDDDVANGLKGTDIFVS